MKIEEFIENQDWFLTCFNMRYGGGFCVGIFQDLEELDRLEHASSYEYEQSEFRGLCIEMKVLPFAYGKTITEALSNLEAIIAKVTVEDRDEYYEIMDLAKKVFPLGRDRNSPKPMQYNDYKTAVKRVFDFKDERKW